MLRSTMRTLLRRRLQESTADQWQNSELDDLLNLGLHEVQKRVVAVDPFFLVYIDEADIVAGQALYKKPVGFWYEFELKYLDSTTGEYVRMTRDDDPDTQKMAGTSGTPKYSHFGQYFRVMPEPVTSLADGLQISWMPTMDMAADSDVPDINIALHSGIVVAAQLVTLGETGVDRSTIAAELESLTNPEIIGRYYHRSAADLDQIKPQSLGHVYSRR
jgi:hypothetical protein